MLLRGEDLGVECEEAAAAARMREASMRYWRSRASQAAGSRAHCRITCERNSMARM